MSLVRRWRMRKVHSNVRELRDHRLMAWVTIPEAAWADIQAAAWDLGATLAGEDWSLDEERAREEWESLAEAIQFADVVMERNE